MHTFIYGRLRQSLEGKLDPILRGRQFILDDVWGSLYTMDLQSSFLCVNESEFNHKVRGEIYDVTPEELESLSYAHGTPSGLIDRIQTITCGGLKVETWVASEQFKFLFPKEGWCRVTSGNWVSSMTSCNPGLARVKYDENF